MFYLFFSARLLILALENKYQLWLIGKILIAIHFFTKLILYIYIYILFHFQLRNATF